MVQLIPVGFGNYIAPGRILAVAIPKSAPGKRSIQEARDKGLIIELSNGRRTKSIIFMDTGHLILSSLEPVTINGRLEEKSNPRV